MIRITDKTPFEATPEELVKLLHDMGGMKPYVVYKYLKLLGGKTDLPHEALMRAVNLRPGKFRDSISRLEYGGWIVVDKKGK